MKKLITTLTTHCLLILATGCWLLVTACLNPALAQSTTADPMAIGVGARSLGMGRAYVGVAEDSDALFSNPAGIARATGPRLSTMYTSLMDDIGYTVIGGVYPYGQKSALGAGIINSSSDLSLTNSNGSSAGAGRWGNTMLFLSAGTYLNNLPAFSNLDKDILIGGSFKYYSRMGSGGNDVIPNISDASGTGYGFDLGILYPATEYLTLGLAGQNLLASKLTASTGSNDDIPSTLKLGAKLTLIGKEGEALSSHSSRRLYLNADYDINGNNLPNTPHLGLEFWPTGNFAMRAGVDGNNPTLGLGLRLSGLEFNYAYHTYDGIGQNATSFFSISYLGEGQRRMLRVKLDNPNDKSIIYEDHVKVSGKVEVVPGDDGTPAGQLTVKVNGVNIPIEKDNSFSAEIPIDAVGKKLVLVEATSTAGDYANEERRLIRLVNFADVPEGYWAKQPIENTGTVGLVEGYPDGTFQPDRSLTRAELATLLVRAKGLKLPERQAQKIFKDVKPDFWAAKYIEVAYREGLIKGYPDKTFRPNNKINKAEGIAIMVRFDNLRVASEVFEKPYWDVPTNHWAVRYIQAAKEAGMLKYVERNYLRPKEKLARAEAVEMLSKTALAGGRIKDLYTWEKGFKPEVIPTRPTIRASAF
ncbi:MAG: S-layer homology domain-containing protein [Candidatus Margulisiibacteriota bacterium]